MSRVGESIVLLHGFGGTRRAWDGVAGCLFRESYLPLALDLPGHGEAADALRPITFSGCVTHLLALSPERFTLCGYSMGGRLALGIALAAPERVERLVLVSTTAGIEDAAERAARRSSEERLAAELEAMGPGRFAERWRSQSLFAGDPPEVGALAREDFRRNRGDALAAVLRGIGTGEMEPLWGRLGELPMPVKVLVGERDAKFRELGERMVGLLGKAMIVVLPGGHDLPRESPAGVAGSVRSARGLRRAAPR
jgi:2-succinyl-6-hydroxy-2,4-cyclohexadiene-1-carboxylate synthase